MSKGIAGYVLAIHDQHGNDTQNPHAHFVFFDVQQKTGGRGRPKTVLFVHGCYWHRHPGCRKATTPSSNVEFWTEKFRQNIERDARNIHDLQEAGWRVGIVWECAIGREPPFGLIRKLEEFIKSGSPPGWILIDERHP
ncbi:Very short patch repair protein [Phaeobacter sp. CECT 5382]|nr:Very short patch repair protein [Phaeobacter sp. CECT 5382]